MRSKVISLDIITGAARKLSDISYKDHLTLYAAQASFFILMSFFPFAITVLAVMNKVLPQYEDALIKLVSSLDITSGVVTSLIDSLKASGRILPLTIITSVWSASRGVYAVGTGISEVYGMKRRHAYLIRRIVFMLYTALFILILLLTLVIFSAGDKIYGAVSGISPVLGKVIGFVAKQKYMIVLIFLFVFFTLIYYFSTKEQGRRTNHSVPRMSLSAHIPGAAFSAVGWVLFSYFYSLYIRVFPKSSYIYGSLAAVVFFLLWLYSCMEILLWGAEINKTVAALPEECLPLCKHHFGGNGKK